MSPKNGMHIFSQTPLEPEARITVFIYNNFFPIQPVRDPAITILYEDGDSGFRLKGGGVVKKYACRFFGEISDDSKLLHNRK